MNATYTHGTANATPHPAITRAALIGTSCLLPSPALWSGRALYPGTY